MVELWEIEWNSSMIQHGADMGTMEFIFAKGGTLSDVNYVMLNQSDDTWEPLIKAVAERDNSHPDIIRKQAEQQQPFFMQSGQQGAQPFMGTGVRSPREANRQFNTAQRMSNLANYANDPTAMNAMRAGKYGAAMGRGIMAGASKFKEGMQNRNQRRQDRQVERLGRAFDRDQQYQQNPTAMNALRTGRLGEAAMGAAGATKDFLARKFPGVKQRMGQFMQGVGDTARHGMEATFGAKDPRTGKRSGGFFENRALRQGAKTDLDQRQTGTANALERQKQRASQGADPAKRAELMSEYQTDFNANEEAKQKLQADIDERGKYAGFGGLRRKIRELGDARRGVNQPDPAALSAAEGVEESMEEGPAEQAMADETPVDDLVDEPTRNMPKPEAGKPQPVDDLVDDEAPPMTRGQELAMGALRAAKYSGAENDPSTYRGSTQTQYGNVSGFDFDNMSREDLQGKFRMHIPKQKAMFDHLVNELGLSPAEAAKEVETTEVQVPDDDLVDDEDDLTDDILVSAERLEVKGWDALLKQLNVR